jgi:hypothetical protein
MPKRHANEVFGKRPLPDCDNSTAFLAGVEHRDLPPSPIMQLAMGIRVASALRLTEDSPRRMQTAERRSLRATDPDSVPSGWSRSDGHACSCTHTENHAFSIVTSSSLRPVELNVALATPVRLGAGWKSGSHSVPDHSATADPIICLNLDGYRRGFFQPQYDKDEIRFERMYTRRVSRT